MEYNNFTPNCLCKAVYKADKNFLSWSLIITLGNLYSAICKYFNNANTHLAAPYLKCPGISRMRLANLYVTVIKLSFPVCDKKSAKIKSIVTE